ncbi:PREDICTED: uncharacterized protein LOC109155190 [Ipomoea nil]|uniref:uncharacterized protein LOC109155190 n=1 Tax=Ipomoea nil TaxID=35883 RepID=UPI0009019EFD|nr:PREDICTED: uncharacterized protein LOC109155190 [Ipomoea nil]
MARLPLRQKMRLQVVVFILHIRIMKSMFNMLMFLAMTLVLRRRKFRRTLTYADQTASRHNIRSLNLQKMVFESDVQCVDNCIMDRRTLAKLCDLLRTHGNLKDSRNATIDEMVISFLHIVAHNIKNRVLKRQTARSGETISRQFHAVLNSILRLHNMLLRKPEPIPDNSTYERWKWFKGCLGALDGTFIKVNVETVDRPRYRTRKGEIATNVLGACTPDMQFIYVLPGWEGSAADGRIFRDAISRMNGLKVPLGNYYLCDAGYTNGNRYLAPYRGQRYHLNEWRQGYQPTTAKEYFNVKHSQARNCIERCFGILKARWAILRDKLFYPVKTQCRIISACCILHNFIRSEMHIDPIDIEVGQNECNNFQSEEDDEDLIRRCETSHAWTEWRDKLAHEMFTTWQTEQH